MNKKVIKERISDSYIKFCEENNMSTEVRMVLAKFRRELINQMDNLYIEKIIKGSSNDSEI